MSQEKFVNPVTGEVTIKSIAALSVSRMQMKDQVKMLEKAVSSIDGVLLELLSEEGGKFETDNLFVSIVQAKRKVFDVDKVINLLNGQTKATIINKDGVQEEKSFYTPNAGVIQSYLANKQERGELTPEESAKYKESFYEKLNSPYVKIEKK